MDIEDAFRSTSKNVFGKEIGELEGYKKYLQEAVVGKTVRSEFSQDELFVTSDRYCQNARFFDYNKEIGKFEGMNTPFDINKIKDIDSLFDAARERVIYSGNKILGNSENVQHSDNVFDSFHVLNSSMVTKGRHIAYSYMMRESEYAFGSADSGNCSNIIRCFNNYELKRCFECCYTLTSDSYFCFNVIDCTDCMFTFNVRNKRNMSRQVFLNKLKKNLLYRIIRIHHSNI